MSSDPVAPLNPIGALAVENVELHTGASLGRVRR